MKYANLRAEAIAKMRQWAGDQIASGRGAGEVFHGLETAVNTLLQEFMCEHDLAGTRYWHHPESNSYFSTAPGENSRDSIVQECIELRRYEYLSRQNLHFGYETRL